MSVAAPPEPSAAAILDGLRVAVIMVDGSLGIVYVNAACERVFGTRRRHVLGAALTAGFPALGGLEERLRTAQATGAGFVAREFQLTGGVALPVTVDCTATPFLAPGTTRASLLLEVATLDQHLRISRDEWRQLQAATSREVVRGLAHEIKNPLGGIRGAAQLLERAYPDSGHGEYTRVIIREVDRLQRLVDRLLGPNRLPQPTRINIHEVVEHVRTLMEAEAPANVHITRDYDPSIPDLRADREQLVQALLNLVRNALYALAERGGTLWLRTRTQRQLTVAGVRHPLVVRVEVEDDGPGVPPALQEKMFHPLVSGRPGGSGLGLAIAQALVAGHGGVIEHASRRGHTVFSIILPLVPSP